MSDNDFYSADDPNNSLIRQRLFANSKMLRNAYDGNGLLLLAAGSTIDDPNHYDRLKQDDVKYGKLQFPRYTPQDKGASNSDQPSTPQNTAAVFAENKEKRTKEAQQIRTKALEAVGTIFDNALAGGEMRSEEVDEVVAPMISDIVNDPITMLSLANLKNGDQYTLCHSVNVAILAISLAIKSDNRANIHDTGVGAMMHDIGKLHIPDSILNKPAALNTAELELMKRHPVMSAKTLMDTGGFSNWTINAVLDHHESVNGKGYPRAIKGSDIGVAARIISIADVYDALTTDRCYRKALSPKTAITLMTDKFADALDANLLRVFVSMVGCHPVGVTVNLSNGCEAEVITVNPNNAKEPAIVMIKSGPGGTQVPQHSYIDLRNHSNIRVVSEEDKPIEGLSKMITREFQAFEAVA